LFPNLKLLFASCEAGLGKAQPKNVGMGEIEGDEREGAEAGAVGEVGCGCVDVGGFCESVERQSSGSNGSISL